jgi:hypothetical protein
MPPIGPKTPDLAATRAALAKKLDTASPKELLEGHLHQTDIGQKLTGSNVKFRAEDEAGHKVTFKPFQLGSVNFERDEFATTLRREAGEATIALEPQSLTLPNGQTFPGYVKPRFKSDDMPSDVVQWNSTERAELLADSAWAEFLGNYDLKLDQYKVVDLKDGKAAVDVDWDCSLLDYLRPQPLDRFKAYKAGLTEKGLLPAAPTTQSLLFEDYVHGKTDLDFAPMYEAIGRIEQLSEAQIREALAPFAEKQFANGGTFGPFKSADELVGAIVGRQKNLRATFQKFEGSLKEERAFYLDRKDHLLPDTREVKTFVKEQWAHLGNWFVKSPFLGMLNRVSQRHAAKALGIES